MVYALTPHVLFLTRASNCSYIDFFQSGSSKACLTNTSFVSETSVWTMRKTLGLKIPDLEPIPTEWVLVYVLWETTDIECDLDDEFKELWEELLFETNWS